MLNEIGSLYEPVSMGPSESHVYPGTLAQFRASMGRLSEHCCGTFLSRDGWMLHFVDEGGTESARSTWTVTPCLDYLPEDQAEHFATIEAYEQPGGASCMVDFSDNCQALLPGLEDPTLGFDAFCEWLLAELWPHDRAESGHTRTARATATEPELGTEVLLPPTPAVRIAQSLGTQGGTLDRVKTARELWEKGIPKTEACKQAHIDPRTYDRYVEMFVDWSSDLPE